MAVSVAENFHTLCILITPVADIVRVILPSLGLEYFVVAQVTKNCMVHFGKKTVSMNDC